MQSIWTCVSRTPLNVGPSNLIPIDLSIQRNLFVPIGIGHLWELTISYYRSSRIKMQMPESAFWNTPDGSNVKDVKVYEAEK